MPGKYLKAPCLQETSHPFLVTASEFPLTGGESLHCAHTEHAHAHLWAGFVQVVSLVPELTQLALGLLLGVMRLCVLWAFFAGGLRWGLLM